MSATNYAMLYQRWKASVADCEALRAEVARLNAAVLALQAGRQGAEAEVDRLTRERDEEREHCRAWSVRCDDLRDLVADSSRRALAAESALSEARAEVERLKAEKCKGCQETIARHREAEEQRAAANVALSEAREVVRTLVNRLDAVHADPTFMAVWEVAQAHRGVYLGPTYIHELLAARSWLARLDAQGVTK